MVSGDEITKVFGEKKISGRCELCGHSDWKVQQDLERLAFIRVNEAGELESFDQLPVLPLICGHCGNIRLFAKNILLPDTTI